MSRKSPNWRERGFVNWGEMKALHFPTFVTAVIMHDGPGDGQVRGISMLWARSFESAQSRIQQVFGPYYARKVRVSSGLRFIEELDGLVPTDLRAYAAQLARNTDGRAALFEYSSFSLRNPNHVACGD